MQRLNRNNVTRFSRSAVNLDIPRTKFNMPHKHTTTFNSGKLIPIFFQECLPGDTFQMDTSIIARMSTPQVPVMDTAYLDYYYFFVPNRLVWRGWQEFMGENPHGAWTTGLQQKSIPKYSTKVPSHSNGDYLGLPTNMGFNRNVSALPFRALRLIWNDWFRSTALQDPLLVNTGDTEPAYAVGTPSNDDLLPVCRFPDYFSTCLPAPQYGEPVQIGLLNDAPVYSGLVHNRNNAGILFQVDDQLTDNMAYQYYLECNTDPLEAPSLAEGKADIFNGRDVYIDPLTKAIPANLYADTSSISMVSVNDLRLAFQVQKYREAIARGGNRYIEIIKSIFNVDSPDARLQRPEYLGGNRAVVNMGQVIQTSESDTTPQGFASGFSKTVTRNSDFVFSCVEHGMIIGVLCVRPVHSYQQGIDKYWSKTDPLDFYVPQLANIGEQPVFKRELFADLPVDQQDSVFGYQEAWADYRYKRSYVSGEMRSNSVDGDGNSNSLDMWHYADDYNAVPVLSDEWIKEDPKLIDRTISVSSDLSDQFIADIYFNLVATRPLPAYSIPGLIDHH